MDIFLETALLTDLYTAYQDLTTEGVLDPTSPTTDGAGILTMALGVLGLAAVN